MLKTFKSTLQILMGVALVVQLAGCYYWRDDRRWHRDRPEHFDHQEHHDPSVDVHFHG